MQNSEIIKLIKRCLDGNRQSFAPVVRYFQARIYRLCFRYLGTAQDAEDAAAEVFIKAFRSLHSYDSRFAFSTWLYRIAVNHSLSLLRRRKLESGFLESEGSQDAAPVKEARSKCPETVFFEAGQTEDLLNALDGLPENYRTVLVLKYQQDLSYKEIGEIMDIPVNTVASHILRGKKILKEQVS